MKNNTENTPQKRKPKKRIKAGCLIFAAVLLITATAIIALLFRLFGDYYLSTSDVSQPPSTKSPNTTLTGSNPNPTPPQSGSSSESTTGTTKANANHYIQPAGAEWNLKLINKWNLIDTSYQPPLATYAGSYKFDSRAIDKLRSLVNASNGRIRVTSAYRTADVQNNLYVKEVNSLINKGIPRSKAEEEAAEAVARPGTSEHQLGLAVDFLFKGYSSLLTEYENTETYRWMLDNCAKYGFILRYPKDKTDITGVMFEPWHFRYVGEQAAQEMMSRGLTLEEYLQEKGK